MSDTAPASKPVGNLRTILVTDVVGSTDLHARLGDDAAGALLGAHLDAVGDLVIEHGGRVVKTLGDGILAEFASARQALTCATAIQVHTRQGRAGDDPGLAVRVGLAAGEVVEHEGDIRGSVVALATRVTSVAAGGEILAVDVVRDLTGPDPTRRFRDRGPTALKGFPESVPLVALDWDDSAPAPPRPRPVSAPSVLVGRDRELHELRAMLGELRAGRGGLALVTGEAGMGKTSVVNAFATEASAAGGWVLTGACWSGEDAPPLLPWAQVVRALLSDPDPSRVRAMSRSVTAPLRRLVPGPSSAERPGRPRHRATFLPSSPSRTTSAGASSRRSHPLSAWRPRSSRSSSCSTTCTTRMSRLCSCCASSRLN